MSDSMPVRMAHALRVPASTLIVALFVAGGIRAQAHAAPRDKAMQGVAMIETELAGHRANGAGLVLGLERDRVYIATANHVVRRVASGGVVAASSVLVRFYAEPQLAVEGQLEGKWRTDFDIAFVSVERKFVPADALKLPLLDPGASVPAAVGLAVVPLGYPVSRQWTSPQERGVVSRVASRIEFRHPALRAGYSGGGLFDADWRITGMTVSDQSGDTGQAIAFSDVVRIAREFQYPIGTVAAGALAGHSAETLTGTAELGRWSELIAANIDYLPPITDMFGQPDFFLVLHSRRQSLGRVEVFAGRKVRSRPFEEPDLVENEPVEVSIIENDQPFSDELITGPEVISYGSLQQGSRVQLRILPSVFATYRNVDPNRAEINVSLELVSFDPDGASGDDWRPEGAERIPFERVYVGSVSFDQGDATDHVRLNASGYPDCVAARWEVPSADVRISLPASGANRIRFARQTDTDALVLMDCSGTDGLLIKVQARTPGAGGRFRLYPYLESASTRHFLAFLSEWSRWLDDPFGDSWNRSDGGSRPSGSADVGDDPRGFGESIGGLVRALQLQWPDVLSTLDTRLKREIASGSDALVKMSFPMLKEAARRSGGLDRICCADFKVLDTVATVQRLESGEAVDDGPLREAIGGQSTYVANRAIDVLGTLTDRARVKALLVDAISGPNREVSQHAVEALRRLNSQP